MKQRILTLAYSGLPTKMIHLRAEGVHQYFGYSGNSYYAYGKPGFLIKPTQAFVTDYEKNILIIRRLSDISVTCKT